MTGEVQSLGQSEGDMFVWVHSSFIVLATAFLLFVPTKRQCSCMRIQILVVQEQRTDSAGLCKTRPEVHMQRSGPRKQNSAARRFM